MKKLIQVSGLLSLLVVLTAATAFAQTGFGTDVNIPFAFTVGDHSYQSGDYIVRIEKLSNGAATLTLTDTKTEEMQRVLMNVNGDDASGEVKLVFDTVDGQRYLTKVSTPDRSYAIVKSRSDKNVTKKRSEKAAEVGTGANLY